MSSDRHCLGTGSPSPSQGLPSTPKQVNFVEIDIEEDSEIAQAAGVHSTPTLQFFKQKERVLHQPGVKMKREYRALIESNL